MRIALLVLFTLAGCAQQTDIDPLGVSTPMSDQLSPYPATMGCGVELEYEGIVLNSNDERYEIYAEEVIFEYERTLDNSDSEEVEAINAIIEYLEIYLTAKAGN